MKIAQPWPNCCHGLGWTPSISAFDCQRTAKQHFCIQSKSPCLGGNQPEFEWYRARQSKHWPSHSSLTTWACACPLPSNCEMKSPGPGLGSFRPPREQSTCERPIFFRARMAGAEKIGTKGVGAWTCVFFLRSQVVSVVVANSRPVSVIAPDLTCGAGSWVWKGQTNENSGAVFRPMHWVSGKPLQKVPGPFVLPFCSGQTGATRCKPKVPLGLQLGLASDISPRPNRWVPKPNSKLSTSRWNLVLKNRVLLRHQHPNILVSRSKIEPLPSTFGADEPVLRTPSDISSSIFSEGVVKPLLAPSCFWIGDCSS